LHIGLDGELHGDHDASPSSSADDGDHLNGQLSDEEEAPVVGAGSRRSLMAAHSKQTTSSSRTRNKRKNFQPRNIRHEDAADELDGAQADASDEVGLGWDLGVELN
jgi:hypothetical protein